MPGFLASFRNCTYPHLEIIVVDDRSTDRTAEVAAAWGAKIVSGTPPPADWGGKSWACLLGAWQAKGDYLLFTDADTQHAPQGLVNMMDFAIDKNLSMASAIPYHLCPLPWEKLLGAFHLALLAACAPFQKPQSGRVFSIGQYLLFERDAYWAMGGHAAVKGALAEDVALAELTLGHGLRYEVYPHTHPYSVRMYDSFQAFLEGWRRNFRLGLKAARPMASLEVLLFFCAWLTFDAVALPAVAVAWIILIRAQRRLGEFPSYAVLLLPLSVACFTLATVLALYDMLLERPVRWRGRDYADLGGGLFRGRNAS